MDRDKHRPKQTMPILREAEVEIGNEMAVREVCRKLGFR